MLQHLHYAVGSIGAITELLGMNAEALSHVVFAGAWVWVVPPIAVSKAARVGTLPHSIQRW